MTELKRTPLFAAYQKHKPRLIDFGGWELPVQFGGINEEHLAVRSKAGIFDVSHMGELRVSGPQALAFLQKATVNDPSRLVVGMSQYSAILNERGGIIDDIFVYRLGPEEFFLCVNAANAERDFEWLAGQKGPGSTVSNENSVWAQIAIQGPLASGIFSTASGRDVAGVRHFQILTARVAGVEIMAARTGYTGEPGFELFIPAADGIKVWDRLLEVGAPLGMVPVGLGARDTLRLEMGYALHGHDINPETTPLEADLEWIVAMDKPDFIGKAALVKQKAEGLKRKRVGFEMREAGVPRDGYPLFSAHGQGKVNSGTKTPSLDAAVGMGYVPIADAADGTELEVEIRGKRKKAVVKKWPFYRRKK